LNYITKKHFQQYDAGVAQIKLLNYSYRFTVVKTYIAYISYDFCKRFPCIRL